MHQPLNLPAGAEEREATYRRVREALDSLLEGEDDWVAAMATVACELHHAFGYFDWTGFYRAIEPDGQADAAAPRDPAARNEPRSPDGDGSPGAASSPDAAAAAELVIGPYQGGHGCLRIPFSRGVCGAAARTKQTQLVDDVERFPGHIACSSSTRSEIVVPILDPAGRLLGVLDVDSDAAAAFGEVDRQHLEAIAADLGRRFGPGAGARGAGRHRSE